MIQVSFVTLDWTEVMGCYNTADTGRLHFLT